MRTNPSLWFYLQHEQLLLEKVHKELEKFSVQLKSGNTRDGSGYNHYTVAYYFGESTATSSGNKDFHISANNELIQAEE